MQLGRFQLTSISGGRFRSDGGTIFGVVPKPLWNRLIECDERNRIQQAANCFLLDTGSQKILIETGYGSKLSEKRRSIIVAEAGNPLVASLAAAGVSPEEIGLVVLSHLHFDHAGGATMCAADGRLVPTFRNAEYITQRREWAIATAEYPELEGAYPQENLLPLKESGQLRLVDGETEIVSGVWSIPTGGHTLGHAAILLESAGETAVFLGDICATTRHLAARWCMAYDVDLLETRRQKPAWLGRAADRNWLVLFDHDPDFAGAFVARDGREFRVSETLASL